MLNKDKVLQKRLQDFREEHGREPKILLHTCCTPCFLGCFDRLGNTELGLFFYNPNIATEEEFNYRFNELERFLKESGTDIKFVHAVPYDHTEFLEKTVGLEDIPEGGARCALCFRLRLEATAQACKNLGYDFFATTLTLSPLKSAEMINRIGEQLGQEYSVEYLGSDFKKRDGNKRSVELCKKYDIYRQNYCGCEFSREE